MKKYLPILLLLFSSCIFKVPPLDKAEIEELAIEQFDEMELKSSIDTDHLRFDIIRQTYTEQVNDSTTETHDVAYHPLGFDLGNGLFFDLNDNLSLRIDKLWSIQPGDDYVIRKHFFNQEEDKATYRSRENEEICFEWKGWFSGKERSSCSTVKNFEDGVEMYDRKGRLYYKIVATAEEKTIFWSKKEREGVTLKQEEEGEFTAKKKGWNNEYSIQDGEILLGNGRSYLLKQNETGEELAIYVKGRKKDYLQYRIKKSADKIFIFNDHNYGYKIERSPNKLVVYSNKIKWYELDLME